jgi:8-amino-7-oxononanoate synthase
MEDLEACLKKVPSTAGILIITDGVVQHGGRHCKPPAIVELAKKYNARDMVDDAHALGVIGKGGREPARPLRTAKMRLTSTWGTFSKSLASLGGYMAGSAKVVDYCKATIQDPLIFSRFHLLTGELRSSTGSAETF